MRRINGFQSLFVDLWNEKSEMQRKWLMIRPISRTDGECEAFCRSFRLALDRPSLAERKVGRVIRVQLIFIEDIDRFVRENLHALACDPLRCFI